MEKLEYGNAFNKSNIATIEEYFPTAIKEVQVNGKTEKQIDFDVLRQEFADHIINQEQERYQMTWPGKKQAQALANTPTDNILRPCKGESKHWEETENVYIEGDNLEALKILQESYLGKIKCIYIDPPYNTGKDFVYRDNFKQDKKDYEKDSGQVDEEGNRLVQNTESNGQFHSDWLSMMYPRLRLARNLLTDDGVIFISIDDNEVHNLRKMCDEIFGERNFVAEIIIDGTPKNDPYIFSTTHEYCLIYAKIFEEAKKANYGITNPLYTKINEIFDMYKPNFEKIEEELKQFYKSNKLTKDNISNYKFSDKKGVFRIGPIDDPQSSGPQDERLNPKTKQPCKIPTSGWRCNIETWNDWVKEDLILFPEVDNVCPSKKTYISIDRLDVVRAYIKIQTRKDTVYLKELFGLNITPFSNPKPRKFLKLLFQNCNDKDFFVLDFFPDLAALLML